MKKKDITTTGGDIHDKPEDQKYLKGDKATLDLPDVKDIPGQEHVKPPKMNEFADITISSDDEEGKGILDEGDEDDLSSVTPTEKELLAMPENNSGRGDDELQSRSTVDKVDDDGDLLNEEVNVSGSDMDIPGSEDDDANEEIGEEDEENNGYSLGGDKD